MAKIIGNTTATPNPRPDWEQDDQTKADYIKNKPDIYNKAEIDALLNGKPNSSDLTDAVNEAIANLKIADLSDAGAYITHSEVVNDLDAGGTDVPLSAEMGKNLYESVNNVFSLCDSGTVYNAAHLGGVNASGYALKTHSHDDAYAQRDHTHDISDVDTLNDRLVAIEDSIDAIGSGGGGGSTTEPLVLTGNCYCSDEDIVSATGTRLVFTVALSGATATEAYNIYAGVTTKRDIVIRLTNTYTPSALGTTDFEPIVYIEAPVYKATLNWDPATSISTYGVKASGTGYCEDPNVFYKVYIEYMDDYATVTAERYAAADSTESSHNHIHYAVCSSSRTSNAKVISCEGFTLVDGDTIVVVFQNGSTAEEPYFQVNGDSTNNYEIQHLRYVDTGEVDSNGDVIYQATLMYATRLKALMAYEFVFHGGIFELINHPDGFEISNTVNTLVGDDANKSVREIATEVVASDGDSDSLPTPTLIENTGKALEVGHWYYVVLEVHAVRFDLGARYIFGDRFYRIHTDGTYTISIMVDGSVVVSENGEQITSASYCKLYSAKLS